MRTATSIDISKRLMNRETGMVALCRAIPICGYYDRRNPLKTYFSVGLLFTYIDNAHFLLCNCNDLHSFSCINHNLIFPI